MKYRGIDLCIAAALGILMGLVLTAIMLFLIVIL